GAAPTAARTGRPPQYRPIPESCSCALNHLTLLHYGQSKEKLGTCLGVCRTQLSTVCLHDRADNCEPHSHPARFGGIEMREDLVGILSGQPSTEIAHTGND